MKKMIFLAALSLSSSAFAYMCEVDMVDNRTNRRITTIRANDYNDDCKEGMKQCRLEIRQRNLLGRADCVRRNSGPTYPNPNPNPYPNPNPNPYPGPGSSDARRMLMNGETAILNNSYVTVVRTNYNGNYDVRGTNGWSSQNNVRRNQLSITNGCSQGLCTNETVIDIRWSKYVTVAGISFDEEFVTRSNDTFNSLSSNIRRSDLAETRGCVRNIYPQLCVGNTVIDTFNRYSTIAGIQMDGRVVLRSEDGWNTLTTNVDPYRVIRSH